jgi:GNAT superfamily N-acetyltransferase
MRFDLTEALIDQLLFCMEDQEAEFLLDSHAGIVVNVDEEEIAEDDGERYYAIPDWQSADGFRLMEKFAASLRNPIVRTELTAALDRGRGVFRAFKDVLAARPEVERLWFGYKEAEMRRKIRDWYNALREEWGIDRVGEEPEETDDLVLEDFRFRPLEPADAAPIAELHAAVRAEARAAEEGADLGLTALADSAGIESADLSAADGLALAAETARGDFAAFALAARRGRVVELRALEVKAEYRGLGVGEELLSRLAAAVRRSGGGTLTVALPAAVESFARVLLREGFQAYETRYRAELPAETAASARAGRSATETEES